MTTLIRSIIGGAIGACLILAIVFARNDVPDVTVERIASPAEFAPLPAAADSTAAASRILNKSPFDGDRGPFVRNQVSAPANVDARLTGILGVAGARRATLALNGVSQTVSAGDDTPLGVVADIESNAVVFRDGRRLVLFE